MTRAILVLLVFVPTALTAQTVAFAEDLYRHGLNDDASRVFLTILHEDGRSSGDRSEALYFLGDISFDRGDVNVALADWVRLVEEFPASERANEIADRLDQLQEVAGDFLDASASSAVARSYQGHGDFWSNSPDRFVIDVSWLPRVEMAVEWYERLIAEFPGTPSAEQAHRQKVMTLLGWEEPGRYGSSYGARDSMDKYMPQARAAFREFERLFPTSRYLDGLRFQIGQRYWFDDDRAAAEPWFKEIVDAAEGRRSFYSQLASTRLANWGN